MRAALLLLALAFLGCATDPVGGSETEATNMRILATGSYAAAQPEGPQAVAITTADDYARVWEQTLGSNAQRPEIDFTRESVVILLAGQRRSGGYSVDPRGVRLEGDVLVVDAEVKSPPPDGIVTMALTSPWAVIAVDTKTFKTVRWNP